MFSTRLIRRSLPLSINPGLRLCKGQYSGGGLASGACCTASHTLASTAGAVYRLKSTAVEHLVDQLPRRERAPLMGHLVLSGSAANAIADTADDPSMVDGSARAMFPARFPEKDRTRPTVHARAAGGGFRPYTNTSASARRCFTSDSEAKDGDTETSESSPEKTTPSRRKAKASKKVPKAKKEVARNANVTEMPTKGGEGPRDDSGGNALPSGQEEGSKENVTNKARKQATKKVPKDRKEAFRQARNAGVTDRLIKGGGVPRDSRDGDGLPPSGQEEGSTQDLTPSWNEKDYKAGGKGAELPAVTGTITSAKVEQWVIGKLWTRYFLEHPSRGGNFSVVEKSSAEKRSHPAAQLDHPVLGRHIVSLGYKDVFLACIENLARVPVWEKRKTLRPVHAIEIAEAKLLKKNVLTEENQTYTLGIVDGQHRLGALLLMSEKGLWDQAEQNVIVEVFETQNEEEIGCLFSEINRAEPTMIVDDPHIRPDELSKCVDKVVLHLYKHYREMFGGKRCRPPSLHTITFKESLLKSGLIERHDLYTPQLLLDYLLRVNSVLSHRDAKKWGVMVGKEEGQFASKKSLAAALKRAKRYQFWLGLDKSWMLV
eukprot:jgi/Undpi1/10279/HiC_scaffold_28.g12731.m1